MGALPPDVLTIISVFAPLVSERVWQRAQVLLVGALLVPGGPPRGRRTVAAILRVMGLGGERRFKNYHRVLSRARWSALAGSRLLLLALVERLVPEGPVVIGIDDTIERRWGRRIGTRGIYRAATVATRCAPVGAISSRSAACAGCVSCCWRPSRGRRECGRCRF